MRLLYTITAYPPAIGGAQIHTHLLTQAMLPQALQVVCHWNHNRSDWLLGTTIRQPSENNYTIDNINVHRLGLTWLEKLHIVPWLILYYPLMAWAVPPIATILQEHLLPFAKHANLIHNIRVGRENLSYASLHTAHLLGIPFVFTPLHHPRWVGWRYKVYLQLYQEADAVIALTQAEKQTLISLGVKPERIHITGIGPVVAPQADGQTFRDRHQLQGSIVLFLGQHYAYKGYHQLLQATTQVWEKYPETQFVFIGPAVKQSDQVFQSHQDPRIHRLGTVSLQEKTDALAACDMLCVPSMQESFGGVFTEAWSFGKPVIGGNIPAVAEVVSDGKDGFLVAQEPKTIATAIIDLLNHPQKASEMGKAGYEKVHQSYTWSKLAQKTLEIYQSLF